MSVHTSFYESETSMYIHPMTERNDYSYADKSQLGWRNIIFIPFGSIWQILLNTSVFLNSFFVIYFLSYGVRENVEMKYEIIYYTLEILYLVDTILHIMHLKMKAYRITRDNKQRGTIALCLDTLTLLPVYEMYLLVTHKVGPEFHIRRYIRTKSIVRLYRVFDYFSRMKATASSIQVWFIVLEQAFIIIMCVHCFGAIWHTLGCWKCDKPNWTSTITKYHKFNAKSHFEWFVISYGIMGNLFLHNYKANMFAVTNTEFFLFLSVMIIGHLMHYMIFLGNLIISYVNQQKRHFYYVKRVKDIKSMLEVWKIKTKLKNLTLNYYDILWERYSGIKDMPTAYELLPLPLKKEVMLDLFWDALNHSLFFQDEDISFKRALALEMKCEFYQPGDYVIQINDFKTKMFYISSGVLEVSLLSYFVAITTINELGVKRRR